MINSDIVGFTSIALVSLLTLFMALRWKEIATVLFVALTIRIIFILIGHYIHPLPDSTADAKTFETISAVIAADGFFNLLNYYDGASSRFISWFIAIPYILFGRSMIMAQSISLFFGMGCILLAWNLAIKLWDKHSAKKVVWTIALFPSLVLYSVLMMREVYFCFFLLVALNGVCDWIKNKNFLSFLLAMSGFAAGAFFHGTMMVGAIVFLIFVGIITFKKMFSLLINFRINLKILAIFLLILISSNLYFLNKIQVSYLGNFKSSLNIEKYLMSTKLATRGNASWPEWTKINSYTEILYKAPVRSIYFLFAPFPWDVKETKHLIGLIDSFFYMYLIYLIIFFIKNILRDPSLKIILLILLTFIFVFGFGIGNFGTGIRHRSKFVIILILLAAPLIKRVIFFKNKK